jgi:hypothetical protein
MDIINYIATYAQSFTFYYLVLLCFISALGLRKSIKRKTLNNLVSTIMTLSILTLLINNIWGDGQAFDLIIITALGSMFFTPMAKIKI